MTTTTTNTKRLVVVVGPTGAGKTDLAIALAQHYGAPIVSTDSRQFYRGMPIGTAQPTAQQLRAAEHHFIASHDITQELSCGAYEVEVLALLDRLFEQHRTVLVVAEYHPEDSCRLRLVPLRDPDVFALKRHRRIGGGIVFGYGDDGVGIVRPHLSRRNFLARQVANHQHLCL